MDGHHGNGENGHSCWTRYHAANFSFCLDFFITHFEAQIVQPLQFDLHLCMKEKENEREKEKEMEMEKEQEQEKKKQKCLLK